MNKPETTPPTYFHHFRDGTRGSVVARNPIESQPTEITQPILSQTLTLWLDEATLAGWAAPKRRTPGGQPLYSDLAIELILTLRLVFHLALRQAEAFARSILRLLGLELSVPGHSTLSR